VCVSRKSPVMAAAPWGEQVHAYCVEHQKVIVNHCPDGRSVFLLPLDG